MENCGERRNTPALFELSALLEVYEGLRGRDTQVITRPFRSRPINIFLAQSRLVAGYVDCENAAAKSIRQRRDDDTDNIRFRRGSNSRAEDDGRRIGFIRG
jgi:hypothetical protein